MPDFNLLKVFKNLMGPSDPEEQLNTPKRKRKPNPVRTFILDSVIVVLLLAGLFYIGSGGRAGRETGDADLGNTAQKADRGKAVSPAMKAEDGKEKASVESPDTKKGAPPEEKSAPELNTKIALTEESRPKKTKPAVVETPSRAPVAPPEKAEKPATAAVESPVEKKDASKPIKPIVSRPVAKAAPQVSSKSESSEKKEEVFRIRFAVCQMAESCQQVKNALEQKGVKVSVTKTQHNLKTYHVALGPWPTRSHTQKPGELLLQKGIKTSLLVSGGKFFLITMPEFSQAQARKTLGVAVKEGIEGKTFSRQETQDMYKVYGGSYGDMERARRAMNDYKKKGIDCIVEH